MKKSKNNCLVEYSWLVNVCVSSLATNKKKMQKPLTFKVMMMRTNREEIIEIGEI